MVTGSRIPRGTAESPTPLTVLSANDIEISGTVNVGDLLNELPALGSTFGTQNSDRFIGTAGLNLLDLRRLGTDRTLVLANGQRHVAGNAGSAAVDVNSIPSALIDRVEVITGGASAIYGADAVTGVVNFILKDDFEGFELRSQTGRSEDGLDRSSIEAIAGFSIDGGRGNAVIALEYSEVGALSAADRGHPPTRLVNNPLDNDTTNDAGEVIHDGVPDELVMPHAGLNFITNGGWFSVGGTRYVFDRPNNLRLQNLGTDFGSSECGDGCDFLDLNTFVNYSTPRDRYAANMLFSYELFDGHTLSVNAKYSISGASGTGQPHFNNGNLRIATDNAYIPGVQGLDLAQILADADTGSFALRRFNVDAGLRGQDNDRETSRVVLSGSGPLTEKINYQANAIYGRTTSVLFSTFNRVNERWYAAADAVLDPDTGQIVCRHTLDPTSDNTSLGRPLSATLVGDCVPLNVFGDGAVSQEAIDYVHITSVRASKIDQTVINGTVSGSLLDLPAGPLGFAAGFEYREESSEDRPDPVDGLGVTFLNVLLPERGEYDVREIYAEARVPLLFGMEWAKELAVDVAVRWSDYSTIGSTSTWKTGLDYYAIDGLRLRATYSEAVRAPNIAELFGPQNQNFFSVQDPCSEDRLDLGRNGRAVREANCRALGIPQGFDSMDQTTRQGLSGGNPGLDAEESESWTVGAVLEPGVMFEPLEGLTVAIDWWDIKIDNAIASATAQQILDRCADAPNGIDNQFCRLITRDNNNDISQIVQIEQNITALEASGVDIEATYNFDLYDGEVHMRLIGTWLDELNSFPFQSDPDSEEKDAGGLGDPEYSAQLDISYRRGRLGVNWSTRYIDSMLRIDLEEHEVNPDAQHPLFTGETFYSDVNVSWDVTNNILLAAGVDNLFDEDLPLGLTGTGVGSGIFDNVGRNWYGSFKLTLER